jgi:hypothetical protein
MTALSPQFENLPLSDHAAPRRSSDGARPEPLLRYRSNAKARVRSRKAVAETEASV